MDEYLGALDPPKGGTLRSVIEFVLKEFPALEVKQAWNVPNVHAAGQYILGVSALTRHLALAPWSTAVIAQFRSRLEAEGYVVRKNLLQVPVDWDIDRELLRDLVEARLAELPAQG